MSQGHTVGEPIDAPTLAVMPSPGVLHVHLLRHGAVTGLRDRTVRGHLDAPLAPEGLEQHAALAEWVGRHLPRPERLLCSDLSRCRDLGERLARRLQLPLELQPALREQHMGDWEGRTWQELTVQHGRAVNDYWDDYVDARPPGGESLQDLAARVAAFWEPLTAQHDGRRLLLVTHTGVIRVLACRALGLPLGEALRFAPPAASHSELQLAAAGAVLSSLGERPWLQEAPAPEAPVRTAAGARPPALRIALSGSAGTGKTTLGRQLAAGLGLPFLEEGMRRRLEGGLDLHRLDHARMQQLLLELWSEQCAAEDAATGGFVADRSPLDFAAFWIFYGFHHDAAATDAFLPQVWQRHARIDQVVLLPWGVLPLASDGVRSTNRWVQFQYQCLVEGLQARHTLPARLLAMPAIQDLGERLARVRAALGAPYQ